jgi:hypothetical protein
MEATPELVASGVLLAAFIMFCLRLSFRQWEKGRRTLAVLIGLPFGLWGFGLLMASFGFGAF